MKHIVVSLPDRSYPIVIGGRLLADFPGMLGPWQGRRLIIVTHPVLQRLYGDALRSRLERGGFRASLLTVPAGEASKCLAVVGRIHERLARLGAERRSVVIALGGGVIGDLAGFVAATYMRGIACVQIPTTLVAQVDSAIGGKTGVNLRAGKNLVGAFHQPELVVCDVGVLKSLPRRQYLSGIMEVVKYALLEDAGFFDYLEAHFSKLCARNLTVVEEVVERCCRIKADIVGADEKEGGLRRVLNLGHTVGHAIETTAGYGKYLHGEAVGFGLIAALRLAQRTGSMDADERRRVEKLLGKTGIDLRIPAIPAGRLTAALAHDKKVRDGRLHFVLPRGIGTVEVTDRIEKSEIAAVWTEMQRERVRL
ncbi:MAG: 3-dehydroquinate synthase [Acidobacteriota bacterium]